MRKYYFEDVKWDIKKENTIYSNVYTHRLVQWISTGKIKKGEVTVWTGGLSGWHKPETLSELIPYFEEWQAKQRLRRKRRALIVRKKSIKTITVIDDEEDTCFLLKSLLGRKYGVNIFTSGKKGINHIKKNKPDLALLDLRLQDVDGLTALSRIKKSSPRTIVAMISAYGDDEVKREAMRYGAYSFLDKPLYQRKIFSLIKRVTR